MGLSCKTNPLLCPHRLQTDAATGEIAGVFVTRQVSLPESTTAQRVLLLLLLLLRTSSNWCWMPPLAAAAASPLWIMDVAQRPSPYPAFFQLADDDLGSKDPATIEIEGIW